MLSYVVYTLQNILWIVIMSKVSFLSAQNTEYLRRVLITDIHNFVKIGALSICPPRLYMQQSRALADTHLPNGVMNRKRTTIATGIITIFRSL